MTLGPQVREGELVFGVAHIFASFNDTFVHVTDLSGRETIARVTGMSILLFYGLMLQRTYPLFSTRKQRAERRVVSIMTCIPLLCSFLCVF